MCGHENALAACTWLARLSVLQFHFYEGEEHEVRKETCKYQIFRGWEKKRKLVIYSLSLHNLDQDK